MFSGGRINGLVVACALALGCLGGTAYAEDPAPASPPVTTAVAAAPAAPDDAAYYVIGVVPGDPSLVISQGDLKAGLFAIDDGAPPVALTGKNGFILGKLDKSGRVAITSVGFINPPSENWGLALWLSKIMKDKKSYIPCGDMTTVFFEPMAGKVLYIGTITYDVRFYGHDVMFSVGNDLERARAFLAAEHPELAARVEQGSYQFRSIDRVCPKSWY